MKNLLLVFFVSMIFIGCSTNESMSAEKSDIAYEEVQANSNGSADGSVNSTGSTKSSVLENKKIIWTGNIEFQVKNVDQSTKKINEISRKYDAFVADMNLTSNQYNISNTIKLRVKNSQFDSLINDLKGESIFMKNIRISSQDVSEEYVDLESRLKTKKEVRERYISILRDKTGSIKDVIAAEEAIRVITEEIEAKEGRLRFLNNQVNFSTITLTIYQEVEFSKEPNVYIEPYTDKLVGALSNGWTIITSLILGLANIWPLFLIFGLIIWKRNWLRSKFKKK